MLTVVTNYDGYAARRSFMDLPFTATRFRKATDPFKVWTAARYRLGFGTGMVARNLWWDYGQHPLVHLRNGISLGRSPWVCSFEDFLPRWGVSHQRFVSRALAAVAARPCKAIIAQSDAARRRQRVVIERHAPHLMEAIDGKLHKLLPPQKLLINAYDDKPPSRDGTLRFILVGHDFFQKGGLETLQVFDRLLERGKPLRLVIVSRMNVGDFATRSTTVELTEARRIIAKHPEAIDYVGTLPQDKVLDLFRASDVGLLLTYSDTFGFSALEAQAAGCPVVTTDINALPEINDNAHGWLVNVPHHPWKVHADIDTAEGRRSVSAAITAGLEQAIEQMIAAPDLVREKGVRCLQRIRQAHDPGAAAEWMTNLYREIVE
jgi:glycosyltransferase involved in cell wall biosynthesis